MAYPYVLKFDGVFYHNEVPVIGAILEDFRLTCATGPWLKILTEESGTVAFMAPELLRSVRFGLEKGVPSKEANIYALRMTMHRVSV